MQKKYRNRYQIIEEKACKIDGNNKDYYTKFIIYDDKLNKRYNVLVETDYDTSEFLKIVEVSEDANKFDIAKALFDYEMDFYDLIDKKYITKRMEYINNLYYVGAKNKCPYQNGREHAVAYNQEEKRRKEAVKVKKL